MEEELFDAIQKPEAKEQDAPQLEKQFPEISFVSQSVKEGSESVLSAKCTSKNCAVAGIILGTLALISWVVIAIGVLVSVLGIIFSVFGLKSTHPKCARLGLVFSVIGLIVSSWYAFAAYRGVVNYNYFTSEFLGVTSEAEKGVK